MNMEPAMNPVTMRVAVDKGSELMKALSSQHRLLILCYLNEGERSVGQIADFLGIRDSTVSQHLAVLRREGILSGRRNGQTVFYRIESEVAREVVAVLYAHYCARCA
jgi:DNA-binding transcriptional ArsR family regulator